MLGHGMVLDNGEDGLFLVDGLENLHQTADGVQARGFVLGVGGTSLSLSMESNKKVC